LFGTGGPATADADAMGATAWQRLPAVEQRPGMTTRKSLYSMIRRDFDIVLNQLSLMSSPRLTGRRWRP
jgi:hypothetical protein